MTSVPFFPSLRATLSISSAILSTETVSCIPAKPSDRTWREGNSDVKWMLHVQVATKWQVYFDDAHCWGKQESFAIKITLRTSLDHSRKAACYSGFFMVHHPSPTSLLALLIPKGSPCLVLGGVQLYGISDKKKKCIYNDILTMFLIYHLGFKWSYYF